MFRAQETTATSPNRPRTFAEFAATMALTALLITQGTKAQSIKMPTEQTAAATSASSSVARNTTLETASIRPYQVHVSDEALAGLRSRLAETRWPDQETVSDSSQGAQLANLRQLVKYWSSDYDWRKAEVKRMPCRNM